MTNEHADWLQSVTGQTPHKLSLSPLGISTLFENTDILYHIKKQTPEFCLAAVESDGLFLEHIKIQTHELCMAAVTQNGEALQFVTNQTVPIFLAAVRESNKAFRYAQDHLIDALFFKHDKEEK